MPCIKLNDDNQAILCVGGPVYVFEGFRFEMHSYCGPVNISKITDSPLVKQSGEFFEAVARWQKLPEEEREQYRAERIE